MGGDFLKMLLEARLLESVAHEMAMDLPNLEDIYLIIHGAQYYFSGINSMSGDRIESEAMCHLEHCRGLLRRIERFYEAIPFEVVRRIRWYEPLVRMKELLPRFREAVEGFYDKKDEGSLRDLEAVGESLADNAKSYASNIRKLMTEIETIGKRRFTVMTRGNLIIGSDGNITQI